MQTLESYMTPLLEGCDGCPRALPFDFRADGGRTVCFLGTLHSSCCHLCFLSPCMLPLTSLPLFLALFLPFNPRIIPSYPRILPSTPQFIFLPSCDSFVSSFTPVSLRRSQHRRRDAAPTPVALQIHSTTRQLNIHPTICIQNDRVYHAFILPISP